MTTNSAVISSPGQNPSGTGAYLTAQWAEAIEVYPIYAGIAKEFGLGSPCADLEAPPQQPIPEQIQRVRRWLDEMDNRIQVQQFRWFLQSPLNQNSTEKALRGLVLRHLLRPKKSPSDGEKIDFLLVQYFALCAPAGISNQPIEMEAVAKVLKPVLGKVEIRPLEWFEQLEELVQGLAECRSLRDVMEIGYLEQGRELKVAAGDMFYNSSALVAFVRFNFLVRRAFIQLMHADLAAIQESLGRLESAGVKTVDCHTAGLSSAESTVTIRQFCMEWTQPFAGTYSETSVGQSFGKLLAIRSAVEATTKRPSEPAAAPTPNGQKKAENPAGVLNASSSVPPTLHPPETLSPAPANLPVARRTSPAPAAAMAAAEVDPEACMETIWEQLIEAPPTRGRSTSSVVYLNTKILLSSWEVAAFVSDGGKISEDLRRAVVARLLVAVAMDAIKSSGGFAALQPTLALAHAETTKLQECVEQAKAAQNTEGAVNLSITAKRLLAYIEEAEGLRG